MSPILGYGDVVWHPNITVNQAKSTEAIQKRACKIILGNSYETYSDAVGSCHLDTLAGRREKHCRRFAEGLPKNERTMSLLPPSRLECHGRSLRNCNNISQLSIRTKRFENSPIPHYIRILNE